MSHSRRTQRSPATKLPQDVTSATLAAMAQAPRFAVVSDIHANLAALKSVLAFLDAAGIRSILSLGDIVGYGPQPRECIATLRTRGIPSLLGNHDSYAFADSIPSGISADARVAMHYTRSVLTDADRRYLRSLPVDLVLPDMAFVHAAYPNPLAWHYVANDDEAEPHLEAQPSPLSFIGHTHIQGGFIKTGDRATEIRPNIPLVLEPARRTCVNPGSVGQPRDGDCDAALIIVDARSRTIEFHRVSYEIDRTAAAIRAVGLPERLARRLRRGS